MTYNAIQTLGGIVSLKILILDSHLNFIAKNLSAVIDEAGERFNNFLNGETLPREMESVNDT